MDSVGVSLYKMGQREWMPACVEQSGHTGGYRGRGGKESGQVYSNSRMTKRANSIHHLRDQFSTTDYWYSQRSIECWYAMDSLIVYSSTYVGGYWWAIQKLSNWKPQKMNQHIIQEETWRSSNGTIKEKSHSRIINLAVPSTILEGVSYQRLRMVERWTLNSLNCITQCQH